MKVTIVLPVYNGGEYLKQSVNSVLTQTHSDFEFIICDDCSTDKSYEFLLGLNDSRVKLNRNEINQGLFPTLNALMEKASGDIIHLWSQDDIMLQHCIEETVKFHTIYPSLGFSYSDRIIIDQNNKIIENNFDDLTPEFVPKELHDKISLFIGSIAGNIANVTLTKKAIIKVGSFDTTYKISADFEMWVRIAGQFDVGRITKKLIMLRDHTGQLSRRVNSMILAAKEDVKIFNILLLRVRPEQRVWAINEIKRKKNVYFFSLFILSLKQRNLYAAKEIVGVMKNYDSFFFTAMRWLKSKVLKESQKDNRFLFQ